MMPQHSDISFSSSTISSNDTYLLESERSLPSIYHKKLKNLLQGPIVVLSADETVSTALDKLAYYDISSVPVLKAGMNVSVPKLESVIGFVDFLDILVCFCSSVDESGSEYISIESLEFLKKKVLEFKQQPLDHLINRSNRNPFRALHMEQFFEDALDLFLEGSNRVAVINDERLVIGIVTQWTIVDYLVWNEQCVHEVPELQDPIGSGKFKCDDAFHINRKTFAIDAFMEMYRRGLHSMAVVDDAGKLIANLSASDLKGLRRIDSDTLLKPVDEYLSSITLPHLPNKPFNELIYCETDCTVIEILRKMREQGVHQVYVTDEEQRPLALVTLLNIMHLLSRISAESAC